MHICQKYMKFFSFTHLCRKSKCVAIYALYPESFCVKNLAIRKVFAFSDSGVAPKGPFRPFFGPRGVWGRSENANLAATRKLLMRIGPTQLDY